MTRDYGGGSGGIKKIRDASRLNAYLCRTTAAATGEAAGSVLCHCQTVFTRAGHPDLALLLAGVLFKWCLVVQICFCPLRIQSITMVYEMVW